MTFDHDHINVQRNHKVSVEEATSYIENALFSLSVWNGTVEKYFSDSGTTFVDLKSHTIRTAFKAEEYDEKVERVMGIIDGKKER